jgi:hypothetical protein
VSHLGGAEAGGDAYAGAAPAATPAGAGGDPAGANEASDPISVIVDAIVALATRIDKLEQAIGGQDGRPGGWRRRSAAAAAAAKTGDYGGQTKDRRGVKTTDDRMNRHG